MQELRALPQDGFIFKTISIKAISNETYKIVIEVQPVGKELYVEELKFSRTGLEKIINLLKDFSERKVF